MSSKSVYFELSLKTKQKSPKKICFKHKNANLHQLNLVLNEMLRNTRKMKKENPKSPLKIIKMLDKIIPNVYFGTTKHRKLFYRIVKRILTQSALECIYKSVIIKGYDFELISWMREVNGEKIRKKFLMSANIFIIENIVKPLILFYYKPVKTFASREIKFIRKENWHRFQSNVFRKLKTLDYIVQNEECKKCKPRGYLKILPKGPCESFNFRSIVSVFRDDRKAYYKRLISKIYAVARKINNYHSSSLYESWKSFAEKTGDRKIYGVKLDIKDAYGSVNLKVLRELIQDVSDKYLNQCDKDFIIKHISNQFVVYGGKVYEWKHGLLQGDPLSSCLCELYMSHIDKKFLVSKPNCFVHRTVDDYFFCSTDTFDVYNFILDVKSHYEINETKTRMNIVHHYDEEISYCGQTFTLLTKEVKNFFNFDGFKIRHKFKLWNYHYQISETKIKLFLKRPMTFSYNNNCFTKMELNTFFNSQNTVLQNFFEGMVLTAYKFDAVVMSVIDILDGDLNLVSEVLEETVEEYSARNYVKIQTFKGPKYKLPIIVDHLKILSYRAFVLVLKRRNEIYKSIIDEIKNNVNLRVVFGTPDIDHHYFDKLPPHFTKIKINRRESI